MYMEELACNVRHQGRVIPAATSSVKATQRSKPMKLHFANCMVVVLVLAATVGCVEGEHPLVRKLEMKDRYLKMNYQKRFRRVLTQSPMS